MKTQIIHQDYPTGHRATVIIDDRVAAGAFFSMTTSGGARLSPEQATYAQAKTWLEGFRAGLKYAQDSANPSPFKHPDPADLDENAEFKREIT